MKPKKIAICVGIIAVVVLLYIWLKPPTYTPLLPYTPHVRGPANATVTVIEFSDFQCPVCQRAFPEIEQARNDYEFKFIYAQFPLLEIHPRALQVAEASECAADQGKFWEFHDAVFTNLQLADSDLINYASAIGLDSAMFTTCLRSGAMKDRVLAQEQEGIRKGVTATPTFFINGKKHVGVLTAEELGRIVGKKIN